MGIPGGKRLRLAGCAAGALFMLSANLAAQLPDVATAPAAKPATASGYVSPYSIKFSFPEDDLVGDLLYGTRGDPREESALPHYRWDSRFVLKRYGAWGPPARHYPPPAGIGQRSADWKRQRVIATGMRFIGYDYQHHHIPDWLPPPEWPWLKAPSGRNGKGVDCSNFTAFVYNQALGIKPDSNVKNQAMENVIPLHDGGAVNARRIVLPRSFTAFCETLQTGDILFLVKKDGEAFHAVLWVGKIGNAPDCVPLVLDSTGALHHHDANGNKIPSGIHLRPVTENSQYFRNAGHALRLIE